METKTIQKFILKNQGLTNVQISKELGITVGRVAGSVSALKRNGQLNSIVIIEKPTEKAKLSKKELRKIVLDLGKQDLHHDEIVSLSGASLSSVYRWLGKTKKNAKKVTTKKATTKKGNAKQGVYTNADGLNKEIARNKMAKYIVDADKSGVVLSLPYSTCAIEKKILVDAPYLTFLGVEKEKDVYKDLKKTVKSENLPIETYCGQLSDKIYGECENTYSHIIADYCGGLGRFGKEVEYAIRNKLIVKGGIMALTFSKPIRGGKDAKKLLSFGGTITNNINDNRCASDKAIEIFFNRIIGNSFKFLEIFHYSDDKKDAKGNGFPMVLIILKRK
jgi:transposase